MDFEPWEDVVNFSGNCRLCLAECNGLTEIFCESSDPNDSWVHKITSLIPIDLRLTDGLPQGLCKDCVLQLSQTHSFISNSLLVDAWLRNRQNTQTDRVKDEIVDSEVEIVPHSEQDPLAFEQYQHFEQPEQEGSHFNPGENWESFDKNQDDEDSDYNPDEDSASLGDPQDDGEPIRQLSPVQISANAAASDLPTLKKGRAPGPKKPPKDKTTENKNYDCTVCQIKFFAQQTLTKHIKENVCIAVPKAGPVAEVPLLGLANVKPDRVESLNECPDEDMTAPDVDGAANDDDDDWWLKEAKESSDDDGGLDWFGDEGDPVAFTCAECEKTFATHAKLKLHVRWHNTRGQFQCDLCPLMLCSKTRLVEHYRTHTGDKPYACDKCPKSFSVKTSLRDHQRTHTGERPYACPVCPKTFALRCARTAHKRVHTGQRPFACTLCPKTFASPGGRRYHVRSSHTGEKPFPCSFCPKHFVNATRRKQHELVHTRECTVKCTSCDQMFKSVKKREIHVRKVHKDIACCAAPTVPVNISTPG